MDSDEQRDYAEEQYNAAFCPACGTSPCGWDGQPDGFHTDETASASGEVTARSLGFTDGWNAVTARNGPLPRPRRRERSRGRQLTDAEWTAYRQGWDEALDAYETDEN